MRKVVFTLVILVILVAGLVGASVAGYIWFKPSKTGTYTGPTGTSANSTETTNTISFTSGYQWIAYPVQVNSSYFWINASTTTDSTSGSNLVVYVMNTTQFSSFQNNTSITYLQVTGPSDFPSLSYHGTQPSTYYVIWMTVVTSGISCSGSIAVTAKI